jgi:hypothetical protein
MERHIASLQKAFARQKGGKAAPAGAELDVARMREEMGRQLDEQAERFRKAAAGELADQPQSVDHAFGLEYSADGSLLFCATGNGLRVYAWSQILAAAVNGGDVLRAKFSYNPPLSPGQSPLQRYIYALAPDIRAPGRVLFAGTEGIIRSLDLTDGAVTTIAEVPGRVPVVWMGFSGDGTALLTVCRPGLDNPRRNALNPMRFLVWDAERLQRQPE